VNTKTMNHQNVVIGSPVRGQWAIMNPPGHPQMAYDFLAVDDRKNPYGRGYFLRHLLSPVSVTSTLAWSQPVFAPLDGVVAESHDGVPDRERINMIYDLIRLLVFRPGPGSPFSAYGGNYVLLKCDGVHVLLAHLRCGSIRVNSTDIVRAGDQLGEVGNSGSSLQPHLHIQVMENEHLFPLFANLLPFSLRTAHKRFRGEWILETNVSPMNGDHFRLEVTA